MTMLCDKTENYSGPPLSQGCNSLHKFHC